MKDYLMLTTKGEFVELNREDFSDSYEMLRKNVNGYIERVSWFPMFEERNIDLWINEEGKLLKLIPTLAIIEKNKLVDILVGNIVFTRHDEEETTPLKEEDFDYIKSFIQSYIVSFNYFDKPINIFKMLGIEI